MTAPAVTGLAVLEANQAAQGALAQQTAAKMLLLWPLLTRGDVESNTPRWLQLCIALLTQQRGLSAAIATQYALAYRQVELGELGYQPGAVAPLNIAQVTTSLMVTGPTAYRREVGRQQGDLIVPGDWGTQGLPSTTSNRLAASTAASAVRHAVDGGRDVMDDVAANDSGVVGYVRITRADPCWFCAMLASRGPVYQGDSFSDSDPRFSGPGNQKVHDGCLCTVVPIYTENNGALLDKSRAYAALWAKTGNALDFRREYEHRGRANA